MSNPDPAYPLATPLIALMMECAVKSRALGLHTFNHAIGLYTLHHHRSISVTELARLSGIPDTHCTSLADKLESLGFAKRRDHPHNRRTVLVAITPSGADAALQLFFPETLRPSSDGPEHQATPAASP